MISIVIGGILAFGSGVGTVTYHSWQHAEKISASRHIKTVQLPAQFAQVTTLRIGNDEQSLDRYGDNANPVNVEYVVTAGAPRYELTLDAETAQVRPVITTGDDGIATVTFVSPEKKRAGFGGYVQHPILRVYGPALTTIDAKNAMVNYTASTQQESLVITTRLAQVAISGAYKTVEARTSDSSTITLDDASIDSLRAFIDGGRIQAGVVRDLQVTHPESCPAHYESDSRNMISLRAVTSDVMLRNGTEAPAKTVKTDCGSVIIGDEDEYDTIEG